MNMMNNRQTMTAIQALLISMALSACLNHDKPQTDEVMVRVRDVEISRNEFIRRSEYAIRPAYCKGSNYIHKKIIINSLIAEKLFSLEAGENNALTADPDYQAYITGRQEQAMRQIHFYKEAFEKAEVSPQQINSEYKVAGRRYNISYFTLKDSGTAAVVQEQLASKGSAFEEVFKTLYPSTLLPSREISWQDPENSRIHALLFKNQPVKGQLMGPVNISDEQFVFLRINGWIDQPALSENDVLNRKQSVIEKLKDEKAWENYDVYVAEIMRAKTLQFHFEAFRKLVNITAPLYLKSAEAKEQIFNNAFWQNTESAEAFSTLPEQLDKINHLDLFKIDNTTWSVGQFRTYLKRHPLVFRKDSVNKSFAERFKLALVDMVRDYYITEDAYNKGYDKDPIVVQNRIIWEDHLRALYQKYNKLPVKSIAADSQQYVIEKYLNPYLDSLQLVYSNEIEINIKAFEALELTAIDMMVFEPDKPFPVVMPSFPLLTTDSRLDYGKTIEL